MSTKFPTTLLWLTMPLALLTTQANGDSLSAYVGYADSLRPSGFFPNPFAGAPGVLYSGQDPSNFSLDSGAFRIDNTGSTSVTIANLTITLNPGTGPIVFSLWSAPVTLLPGQKAIYAQTAQYNFDSSDFGFLPTTGIDATHPLGGCTNPAALTAAQQNLCIIDAPTISFKENGNLVTYTDKGNVLDTFGYDFINGSSDGNESINWNPAGSFIGRGGNSPEPSTLALFGTGLLCAWFGRRRINRRP